MGCGVGKEEELITMHKMSQLTKAVEEMISFFDFWGVLILI